MVFPGSRYEKTGTYTVRRRGGPPAAALRLPLPGPAGVRGYFRRNDGQRLDHVAAHFLNDPTAFWRLCDAGGAVVPDALASHELIGIPTRPR